MVKYETEKLQMCFQATMHNWQHSTAIFLKLIKHPFFLFLATLVAEFWTSFAYTSIETCKLVTEDMLIKLFHLLHIASVGWSCLDQAKKYSWAPGLVFWYVKGPWSCPGMSACTTARCTAANKRSTAIVVCPLLVASQYTQNVDLTSHQSRHVGIFFVFGMLWHFHV